MNESLQNSAGRAAPSAGCAKPLAGRSGAASAVPILADALFALWLFTEVGMEHSAASRVCMALFLCAVAVWMCMERRVFCSYWMAFALGMLVWGLVGARAFALAPEASMDVVKTLCINLVFLFFLYQYLLLHKGLGRVFTLYIAAAGALMAYMLLADPSFDLEQGRFGVDLGINPNWVGVLLGIAFTLSLQRALNGRLWWLLAAVPLAVGVALTKSTKAYVLLFMLLMVVTLLRWPRRWWLKLAVLLGVSWALFAFVLADVPLFNWIDTFFLQRIRYVYENLFLGWDHENSLTVRQGLAAVGREAFLARPLTGYGLDGFRFLAGTGGVYSHNNYVELAVSGGIPMLALYYAPQLVALVRGAKRLRGNPAVQLTFAFALCALVMDVGMVSYVDRTLGMIPLLLMAATRMAERDDDRGDCRTLVALLENPYRIVRWCSTHDRLTHMDDERYLKLLYRGCTGKRLRLHPPVTFNEKQQWMKLYDRNPVYHTLADKLAVRDFVTARAGADCLIPLLGSWDRAQDVDFSALPDQFALKCTHDSGSVWLCPDKRMLDEAGARAFLAKRLQRDYSVSGREWPYEGLVPRVMAEAYLGKPDGTPPDDYKFYYFDGVLRAILLCTGRTRHGVTYIYFDPAFALYPINHDTQAAVSAGRSFDRPERLDEMLALSKKLAEGLRFVRVDLYEVCGRVYFGELTLFDNSGFATDLTREGDAILGAFLRVEEKQ